jgi:hypothetical protein
MKKYVLILASLFTLVFGSVQADLGVNVGVSGQMGLFGAEGTETEDGEKQKKDDAMIAIGYASVFLEKTLGSKITVGVDYVPDALASETQDTHTTDQTSSGTNTAVNQVLQVDFEDLTTIYVAFNVTENFYVKAGQSSVDVITNEKLGTGSKYGNTSLDGTTFGFGYNKTMDNGIFFRAEANHVQFDGVKLTSQTACVGSGCKNNTVSVDEINGASGKISIGKSF